ncbi:MAG TPA: OmpA family protein [Stellaceae bacterium]|jgi:outer membrane protein OmpA-like peptidoglycan-associated protein|nr:OmpA family protein [Stellaceae bacterium]
MMRRALPALASIVLLTGCPRQALFVVLPNAEGGGVGAITVEEGKTATTLDQPYATAESRAGSTAPVEESRGNISVIFRSAMAAQPILPHHFRLYFIAGSAELTPESKLAYRAVFDDTKQRPVYEIEVIGFTDTVGNLPDNQALSLSRAASIRDRLVRDGLDRQTISIVGRGKHDLLVPSPDQTPEPRNRRGEITVR